MHRTEIITKPLDDQRQQDHDYELECSVKETSSHK